MEIKHTSTAALTTDINREQPQDSDAQIDISEYITEQNLQSIALFFKQTICSQQQEEPIVNQPEQDKPVLQPIQEENILIPPSEQHETPQFGIAPQESAGQQTISLENQAFSEQNANTETNQILVQAQEQLKSAVKLVGIKLDAKNIWNTNKLELYKQQTDLNNINYEQVEKRPLFGIDHSLKFFQTHPALAQRLKTQQTICQLLTASKEPAFLQLLEKTNEIASPKLTPLQFQQTLITIFLTTFRKIEQYLFNCKKRIIKLGTTEIRYLHPILINPSNTLHTTHLETWNTMIKLAYNLPTKVEPKAVEILYAVLVDIVRQNQQQNQEEQLEYEDQNKETETFWNQTTQRLLCQLFLSHKSVQDLVEDFNKQISSPINVCTLRLKLQQLVKHVLKAIEYQLLKYDPLHQHPLYLSQKDYKVILRDQKAFTLRQFLIKLYLSKELHLEDVKKVVETLQKILLNKGKQIETEKKNGVHSDTAQHLLKKKKKTAKTSEEQESEEQPQSSQADDDEYQLSTRKQPQKNNNNHQQQAKRQLTLVETLQRPANRQSGVPPSQQQNNNNKVVLRNKLPNKIASQSFSRKVSIRPNFVHKSK